jgi:hypothetical protein
VYKVFKRSYLTEIIIPFFIKYPILGIKALDFKDFCSISELIKSKAYYNKEGLDQIIHIKANFSSLVGIQGQKQVFKKKKNLYEYR